MKKGYGEIYVGSILAELGGGLILGNPMPWFLFGIGLGFVLSGVLGILRK